jgi:hypothetical protein
VPPRQPEPAPASVQAEPVSPPAPLVICPYCRQAITQAITQDSRLAGQTVGCPHCGGALRMPSLVQAAPLVSPAAVQVAAPPNPAPFDTVGSEEDDEPSQRLRRPEGSGAALGLGVGSMILGLVALLFSLIPCIGLYSLPLSGVGLLLGVGGGIVAVSRGGRGIGFPIAGSAINAAAITVALVWVGLASYLSKADDAAKRGAAKTQTKVLTQACDAYRISHGTYPPSLQTLLQQDEEGGPYLKSAEALIDPWKQPYQYNPAGPNNAGQQPDIWANAPDGQQIGNWPRWK